MQRAVSHSSSGWGLSRNSRDTCNFDREFTKMAIELTPTDKLFIMNLDQDEFLGFSYTNPEVVKAHSYYCNRILPKGSGGPPQYIAVRYSDMFPRGQNSTNLSHHKSNVSLFLAFTLSGDLVTPPPASSSARLHSVFGVYTTVNVAYATNEEQTRLTPMVFCGEMLFVDVLFHFSGSCPSTALSSSKLNNMASSQAH
ncbi:hypothetical protein QQF64_024990 [Cirrhinus molitorella]|uniref:AGC-kinase C-terminal domain-containing protein n=1 Tax=Cirrhinus molitorella TaxID=172907 RepID=A0ABR3NN50_9TELE